MKNYIYLYGMICGTNSFMLNEFPTPDNYTEIQKSYRFAGGETGTCAAILAALGENVRIDGTHIGRNVASLTKEFFCSRNVDISSLNFAEDWDGLEDHILITGDTRTPMGMFGGFFADAYNSGVRRWNKPKENDIMECTAAAIDPFFSDDSDLAAELCVKHNKPYVTIDCRYDSYIHKNSAVSVISGESIENNYRGKSRDELFPLYAENGGGLTVITNGGKEFFYGRKGEMKRFTPYKVNVVSTLGAGDTFKAGCTYALAKGMNDDDLIRFASACAAAAISRYPLQLDPPTMEEIKGIIDGK